MCDLDKCLTRVLLGECNRYGGHVPLNASFWRDFALREDRKRGRDSRGSAIQTASDRTSDEYRFGWSNDAAGSSATPNEKQGLPNSGPRTIASDILKLLSPLRHLNWEVSLAVPSLDRK